MTTRKATRKPPALPKTTGSMEVLQKFRYIVRAAQRHSQWIESETGLAGAQLWVLAEIRDEPGIRSGDVAKKMALHQSTASNLIDRLAARRLIVRAREESDARVVRLRVTAAGERLLAKAPEPLKGLLPHIIETMDAPARARLSASLDELAHEIRRLDERFELMPLPFTE